MSRIGKKPIPIPPQVKVEIRDDEVMVIGPKGTISRRVPPELVVTKEDSQVVVKVRDEGRRGKDAERRAKSLYGLTRTLIANMIAGVSEGFSKTLEIVGTGYRVDAKGKDVIEIDVGFSHKISFKLPPGITAEIGDKNVKLKIKGADKEIVGQVAANIRRLKPPEPYKGKGIRYEGEKIRMKAGKSGKAAASS